MTTEQPTFHIVERDRMTGWKRHFWVCGSGLTEAQADAEIERCKKLIVGRYEYTKEADGTECRHEQ